MSKLILNGYKNILHIYFSIFQLLLKQYIWSLGLNFNASWPNKYNFIDKYRKKILKNLKFEIIGK